VLKLLHLLEDSAASWTHLCALYCRSVFEKQCHDEEHSSACAQLRQIIYGLLKVLAALHVTVIPKAAWFCGILCAAFLPSCLCRRAHGVQGPIAPR
jgi:hypothetical protein